jgi:hypothetical protein
MVTGGQDREMLKFYFFWKKQKIPPIKAYSPK